jgi:hypothetical protein
MPRLNISTKSEGNPLYASEINAIVAAINTPGLALGDFAPRRVMLDRPGAYNAWEPEADADIIIISPLEGIVQRLKATFDGTVKLSVQGGVRLSGHTNGAAPDEGDYLLTIQRLGGENWVTLAALPSAATAVRPLFVDASCEMNATNTELTLVFSEPVYGDAEAGSPIELADLDISFAQGDGAATAWTFTELLSSDDEALVGGETTVKVIGEATGTPDGQETLTVTLASGAGIYDAVGNAMAGTEDVVVSLVDET